MDTYNSFFNFPFYTSLNMPLFFSSIWTSLYAYNILIVVQQFWFLCKNTKHLGILCPNCVDRSGNITFLTTMLDINYLQFYNFNGISQHKQSWRKLLYIYINHKPIDFSSYGHWLETSKSANRNPVPSPNTKNHLLSLSELADRK